jgi:hypothetical protein
MRQFGTASKVKWNPLTLFVLVVFGTALFFTMRLIFPNNSAPVTETVENILEINKDELDKIKPLSATREGIFKTVHEMANTLIVAEDNRIIGEIPITDSKVIETMARVNASAELTSKEKEILLNILHRWKQKDFSQGVKDHNYPWNKLNGNIGRAKDLRPEYKK